MVYNLDFKAKIQFVAPTNFPVLINRAALAADIPSQTRYIQLAVCTALARDLGMDEQDLIDSLPPTRGKAAVMFGDDRRPLRKAAPRPGR